MDADKKCPVFCRDQTSLEELLRPVRTAEDVAALLARLDDVSAEPHYLRCVGDAFKALKLSSEQDSQDKVQQLFAAICRWALDCLGRSKDAFPSEVDVWTPGAGPRRVSYSAAQCRGLLANALLMNVEDTTADVKENTGGLRFNRMFQSSSRPVAGEKLACLLAYFMAWLDADGSEEERQIAIERRAEARSLEEFRTWTLSAATEGAAVRYCELHDGGMEAVEDADAFVNFANPNFGYGKFIASCTQEEIIQACCPEFNVGMLHQGLLTDDEVVNVFGVRRYSSYTGYDQRFKFAGPWTQQPLVQTILTMDATTNKHFTEQMVLRDIRKAFLCFQGCGVVSTGRWGCGVFRGMPAHKFAQQVVAAALAEVKIHFSTFGTSDGCDQVLELLKEMQPTAAQLLVALLCQRVAKAGDSDGTSKAFLSALRSKLRALTRQESHGALSMLSCTRRRQNV